MAVRHDADPKALIKARRREAAKPGRAKPVGRGSGLTPRVRRAIELIVYGLEEDQTAPVTQQEAAERAGITARALRAAMQKPAVDAFYRAEIAAMRNGEKPASIRAIAAIRDDASLQTNAAGQRVRLEAAKVLAFDPPGQQVNVQINNRVSVETPGYVIDLTPDEYRDAPLLEHEGANSIIDLSEDQTRAQEIQTCR